LAGDLSLELKELANRSHAVAETLDELVFAWPLAAELYRRWLAERARRTRGRFSCISCDRLRSRTVVSKKEHC